MSRPDPSEYPAYAHVYVDRVQGDDPVAALSATSLSDLLAGAAGDRTYAPGKWTVKEVVGHIADTERIFAYRILAVARGDQAVLPGFEQDDYVRAGGFGARPLDDLMTEFRAVRQGTLALLRGLPAEAWGRRGTANGFSVTVRGLAFLVAGHELHHAAILRERYLPRPEGPGGR